MFEYTKDNYFKFGYDGKNNFQGRTSSDQKFTAEYGPIKQLVKNWREANELAAKTIYDQKQGELFVLLSGGMDSEICLKSFLDQDLDVRAVTLRFLDVDQKEEIAHVERIKRERNFKHEYVDISINSFLTSKEFEEICDRIKLVSPIIATHLWLADKVQGMPVIAQGEVHLQKDVPPDYVPGKSPYFPSEWRLIESERLCGIYRYFSLIERPAVPGFFQYLPEQFFSYLTHNDILIDLVNNRIEGKLGTRSSKNLMSRQFYPDVPFREKLHGWEAIQELHDEVRNKLAIRYPHNDDLYFIEVKKLIGQLSLN